MVHLSTINRHIALGLLAALVFVGSVSPLAYAANESITLSPTSKRYQVSAGGSISDELIILNDGDVAYDFTVYTTPYSVNPTTYDPDFATEKINADAYSWVSFTKSKYSAGVRDTIKIPFTVQVPANASPGGHYGVIFAEVQPAQGEDSTIARKKRVGMILQITVNGDVKLAGSVKDISTGWFQNQAPVTSKVSVENTGNTDFDVDTKYEIFDVLGNTRYKEEKKYAVYPDSTRPIELMWQEAPWIGLYKTKVSATVLDTTTTEEAYVLLAPTWFVYTIIAVCGAGVFYAIRRPTKKK